uniref:Uncharacterized protein n=1 Tax=Salix viminalis TaxID=40686 RepID=A0A6N2MFB0_SALVM
MSTQVNAGKGKCIDVGSASISLRAKMKGKDKASTSSVSYIERDIEMTGNIVARLLHKMELNSQQDMAKCCIYRVPNSFRNVKLEAYTPQLISIGPLHRGDEKLKGMEEQKLRYFKEFAERDGMDTKKIEDLVMCIKNKEAAIRARYSENFNEIRSSDFIEMILLDAVFIIEFFQHSNDLKSQNLKPWMIFDIREDLMLLENQLPFFIIEKIYDLAGHARKKTGRCSFLYLATVHFGKYIFSQGVQEKTKVHLFIDLIRSFMLKGSMHFIGKYMFSQGVQFSDPDDEERTKHFTDLIRRFMLKGSIQREFILKAFPVKLKYNAVMLRQAGMKFQVTEDKCLVNITFRKGVLIIPRLEVDYCSERLVRNIMAFEQCFKPFKAYVCNYIMFMDHLIDSAEDVDLLAENRIIHNLLGDDAALSDMINKLCETIPVTYTCYDDICGEMNAYYENPWNHRKATLKLRYGNCCSGYPADPHFDTDYRSLQITTQGLEKDKFIVRASNMKNHVEQASASNMEDYVSSSQKKGKGFDVVGSDSDIDYKDINNACTTNSERDDKLSASSKGKDIAFTSSISNPKLKIEMTSKILAQLNDKMKELSSKQNRDHCCIYRVPKSLRNVNWKAYTPLLISVGPLHREIKRIQTMQNHKWRCFKEFTEQDGMIRRN